MLVILSEKFKRGEGVCYDMRNFEGNETCEICALNFDEETEELFNDIPEINIPISDDVWKGRGDMEEDDLDFSQSNVGIFT